MGAPGKNFYIAHPPTTGMDDYFFKTNEPLGAGRVQMLLSNNSIWLQQQNQLRILSNHPGFYGFNDTGQNGYAFVNPPVSWQISWNTTYNVLDNVSPRDVIGANANLGYHYVWPYYNTGYWPEIGMTFRYRIRTSGAKMGVYFTAAPGTTAHSPHTPVAHGGLFDSGVVGNGWNTASMVISLQTNYQAAPLTTFNCTNYNSGGLGESISAQMISLYIGAVVSEGAADLIGITTYVLPTFTISL